MCHVEQINKKNLHCLVDLYSGLHQKTIKQNGPKNFKSKGEGVVVPSWTSQWFIFLHTHYLICRNESG